MAVSTRAENTARCRRWREKFKRERPEEYEAWRQRQREYHREWCKRNRARLNANEKVRRQGKSAYINSVKENKPCADCGVNYPLPVMEFDHVRGEKIASVADMSRSGGFSLEAIQAEIEKCDLVCANCHRIRHL